MDHEKPVLRDRARSEFEASWFANNVTDEMRQGVLVEILFLALAGERVSVEVAARAASIPSVTVRSWRHRDVSFAAALDGALARATEITPLPAPTLPGSEPSPTPDPVERQALIAEIDRWRWAVGNEKRRARHGRLADPRRAERKLEQLQARLAAPL